MLIGRSWDELPFPGTFQSGRREKIPKIKNVYFPFSAHNYHRITMFMSMYMFLRVPNTVKYVLNSLLNKNKGQNPR